jgi:hypothetical protein
MEETTNVLHLKHSFFSAEAESRSKNLKRVQTWCWRRMEYIIWNDRVKNKEVLHGFKEERDVIRKIKNEG